MEVGGQRHDNDTHFIGGWIGSYFRLTGCGKSRLTLGFDQRTVQLEGSGYTGYGTPVYL